MQNVIFPNASAKTFFFPNLVPEWLSTYSVFKPKQM